MPVLTERYDGEWWAADAISMDERAWTDTWNGPIKLGALLDQYVR